MAYDSALISFTTKTNKVDLVDAAHINAVQAECVTIETILGTNVKGDRTDLKTRLNNMLDADGSMLSGSSFPSPALPSQSFYRTDLDSFYIRNAANSAWNQFGASLSNALFSFSASCDNVGFVTSTTLTGAASANYNYWAVTNAQSSNYITIIKTKFIKIAGVSTVTVWARIWQNSASTANCKVTIGSVSGNVSGTNSQTTPEWKSFTIDVSSLVNNTTYDVTIAICNTDGSTPVDYLGSIIAFGS